MQVEVKPDGTSTCSDHMDFTFLGFTVSGTAASLGSNVASPGVAVVLTSMGGAETLRQEGVTATDGSFSFGPVIPGRWRLSASHAEWTTSIDAKSVEIDVNANVDLGTAVHISGFRMSGKVVANQADQAPLQNALVIILGANTLDLQCDHTLDAAASAAVKAAGVAKPEACVVRTDKSGMWTLQGAPDGKYTVVVASESTGIVTSFTPSQQTVTVAGASVSVPTVAVSGFALSGSVLNLSEQPMAGVDILVDGQKATKTDAKGAYTLRALAAGTHDITASAPHIQFAGLSGTRVGSNMQPLRAIRAVTLDVCGHVDTRAVPAVIASKASASRTVKLVDAASKNVVHSITLSATAKDNGAFCFSAKPGTYTIELEQSSQDANAGIVFAPTAADVVLGDSPVLDAVTFTPAQQTVRGTVSCLAASCPADVHVYLLRSADQPTTDAISSAIISATGAFEFSNVWPGSYVIRTSGPVGASGRAQWCFGESHGEEASGRAGEVSVTVTTADVNDVSIQQTGFVLPSRSQTNMRVSIMRAAAVQERSTEPGVDVSLTRGKQHSVCVAGDDTFHLIPDACSRYVTKAGSPKTTFTFNTAKPKEIVFRAGEFRVRGTIKFDGAAADDKALHDTVTVSAHEVGSTRAIPVEIHLMAQPTSSGAAAVFEAFIRPNVAVVFKASSQNNQDAQKQLLFYPEDATVTVEGKQCETDGPVITARLGLVLSGAVQPALGGVRITATVAPADHSGSNQDEALGLAPGMVVKAVETDAKGLYQIGPLHAHVHYTLDAHLEGYTFQRQAGTDNFVHRKLGHVEVSVVDDVTGEGVEGALLALSGTSDGNAYRRNNATGTDGSFRFGNLFPGSYFVRAMLKEYTFTPASASFELEEAGEEKVAIQATRTAYSAFGTVVSAKGDALAGGVRIIAEAEGVAPEATVRHAADTQIFTQPKILHVHAYSRS